MPAITPDSGDQKNRSGRIVASDGLSLFYQWQRAESAKAVILIVHGVGEHIGRYRWLENWFCEQGFICYGYDHRGHGLSEGSRVHVENFSQYAEDLQRVLEEVRKKEPGLPIFLFSHSMGTVVALMHAISHHDAVQGIILSSCAIRLGAGMPAWAIKFVHLIASKIPRFRVPTFIKETDLSHDSDIINEYRHDKLVHHSITLNWLVSFQEAQAEIVTNSKGIGVPLLFLHSKSDRVTSVRGARQLYESIGSSDKTFFEFDAMGHELHNEVIPKREEFLQKIVKWCNKRLGC